MSGRGSSPPNSKLLLDGQGWIIYTFDATDFGKPVNLIQVLTVQKLGVKEDSLLDSALTEVERQRGVVVGLPVGDEVDFMLPLLLLEAEFGPAVVADAAAAQGDDEGPHQPEP